MCPHSTRHVSSFCYICVLIILCMCPHTAVCVLTATCVLILLHMCPHTAIYMCPHTATYVSSSCCICVLILLHMCPHTAPYESHTATYVSSYCYVCGLAQICHGIIHLTKQRNKQGACSTQHNTFFFAICCAWTREHLKKIKKCRAVLRKVRHATWGRGSHPGR